MDRSIDVRAGWPIRITVGAVSAALTIVAIFVLGRASSSAELHAAALLATVGVATLALWFGLRAMPALRAWSIGGMVATLAVAVVVGGLRSQPAAVHEQVVRADPAPAAMAGKDATQDAPRNELLGRGRLESLEHHGRGTASLIRTKDGRTVLTLTGFESDAGPDLEVRLVAGDPRTDSDVEAADHVTLGRLKGTSGDQQYVLPRGVDASQFTHVYVWCRAFSVGFSRARLA